MEKPNNPFVIGNYSGTHYFCDRVAESKELIRGWQLPIKAFKEECPKCFESLDTLEAVAPQHIV